MAGRYPTYLSNCGNPPSPGYIVPRHGPLCYCYQASPASRVRDQERPNPSHTLTVSRTQKRRMNRIEHTRNTMVYEIRPWKNKAWLRLPTCLPSLSPCVISGLPEAACRALCGLPATAVLCPACALVLFLSCLFCKIVTKGFSSAT